MPGYTRDDINKIGNTIIFLAEKMQLLSKTKLLKLLYLLEEFSVKKYHAPFLDLKFEVWQAGPVAKDIFVDLSGDETVLLKDFIKLNCDRTSGATYISPIRGFSDDEFSDNEMALLNLVVDNYRTSSATELVKLTHRKNSPWYQIAKEHNLLEQFESGMLNSSNYQIDFLELLEGNKAGMEIYREQKEFKEFAK